ncbi:MAG: hypothetical protein R3C11_18770 [Planctomycetaceae bacterium]
MRIRCHPAIRHGSETGDDRNGIAPIPYRGAVEMAARIVASADQPEAAKICSLRAVYKGFKYGELPKISCLKLANVCIDELLNKALWAGGTSEN